MGTESGVRTTGQTGYEAYAAFTGGKTFDGRDMPSWKDLPQRIQDAWNAAATAILNPTSCNIPGHFGCTTRLQEIAEASGIPKECGKPLPCGGVCTCTRGHVPPCECCGDTEGPGSCPA
jgi:hypothetical protein